MLMPDYRVRWEIDIDADSPREAAEKAREIQLDPESTAIVFEVSERYVTTTPGVPCFILYRGEIDLGENE